jgi:hypothetical protein
MATGDNQKQAAQAIRIPDVVLIFARIGRAVRRAHTAGVPVLRTSWQGGLEDPP